jgi:hypothetical protein
MLIFGGETTKTFQFDTREVQALNKQATVKTSAGQMSTRARLGYSSDWVARKFYSLIYCIDAGEQYLHVFNMKEKSWVSQPLAELGIPRQ